MGKKSQILKLPPKNIYSLYCIVYLIYVYKYIYIYNYINSIVYSLVSVQYIPVQSSQNFEKVPKNFEKSKLRKV